MEFDLSKELKILYETKLGPYPPAVITGFFSRMTLIKNAKDERDLRNLKGARFEKLTGDRMGEYSMRVGDGWRLILELVGASPKTVILKEITNHYDT